VREDEQEEVLPVGRASSALAAMSLDATPLDVAAKVQLLRTVAEPLTGAEAYSAVFPPEEPLTPDTLGLCWGFVLFPQSTGAIGRVFRLAEARERHAAPSETLAAQFGEHFEKIRSQLDPDKAQPIEARLAPVDGNCLWEAPWLDAFRRAGALPQVRAAQNEVAVREFFDGMLPVARAFSLTTPRALALLLDRAIDMGVGGARSWVMKSVGPIQTRADRDHALAVLGYGPDELSRFQSARGLEADGKWGPLTHAELVLALSQLGAAAPVPIPSTDSAIASLIAAARSTPFADRVRALAESNAFDDSVSYSLG
jgi:hypothetical protein